MTGVGRPTILRMPASTESLDPDLELAAEFPAASEDDWRSLVAAVLRKSGLAADADPIEALSTTTYEGIAIRPLYTSGPAPAVPRVPHGGALGRAHLAPRPRPAPPPTRRC